MYEPDKNGLTPCMIGANYGNESLVQYIMNKEPRLALIQDKLGENALHKAARANCLNLVVHLHEKCGVSTSLKNFEGLTGLELTEDE